MPPITRRGSPKKRPHTIADGSGSPVLISKKAKLINFNDIELTAEEREELGLDDEDLLAEEQSPATRRADGCADPEVCSRCGLEGLLCEFEEDGRKTGVSKPSCKHCVTKKVACRKPPRKTWRTMLKLKYVHGKGQKDPEKLKSIVESVREALEARQELPLHRDLPAYPGHDKSVSGYDLEWSDYEDALEELKKRPAPAVKFARRSARAAEESLEQLKLLVNLQLQTHDQIVRLRKEMYEHFHPGSENPIDPAAVHDEVVQQGEEVVEAFRATLDINDSVV